MIQKGFKMIQKENKKYNVYSFHFDSKYSPGRRFFILSYFVMQVEATTEEYDESIL